MRRNSRLNIPRFFRTAVWRTGSLAHLLTCSLPPHSFSKRDARATEQHESLQPLGASGMELIDVCGGDIFIAGKVKYGVNIRLL